MSTNLKSNLTFTAKDFANAAKTSDRRAKNPNFPANSKTVVFGEFSRYKARLFPGVAGVCLMVEDAETTDDLSGLPAVVFQSYTIESFADLEVIVEIVLGKYNKPLTIQEVAV